MRKWILVGPLVLFAGWWLRHEVAADTRPRPEASVATAIDTQAPTENHATPSATPFPTRAQPSPTATTATTATTIEKLAADSPMLRNRLEEQIPRRLYAEAARCYHGGLPKDNRLDLTYHLHVSGGAVVIGDLRTVEDTLGDAALAGCIRERILATRWRDEALPDLDEDDDLYMRAGGFERASTPTAD